MAKVAHFGIATKLKYDRLDDGTRIRRRLAEAGAEWKALETPCVIVLQEGVALQVRVVSTRLVRTMMMSLKKLSRSNPSPRPEDWLHWHEER